MRSRHTLTSDAASMDVSYAARIARFSFTNFKKLRFQTTFEKLAGNRSMAAVLAVKFCHAIELREWGLLDMDYVVERLSPKYCIAFESIIGPMFEEMTVNSKSTKPTMARADGSCTAPQTIIDKRIGA